jgi:hypothetical protein
MGPLKVINKFNKLIFLMLKAVCYSLLFLDFASAQSTLHDTKLNKLYQEILKTETAMAFKEAEWLVALEAEQSRIESLVKNLEANTIKQELSNKIKDYVEYTHKMMDALDRSKGMVNTKGGPWKNNKYFMFFFNRPKKFAKDRINLLYKNIQLYLDGNNYIPAGDRLYLILDALLEMNLYVVQFSFSQFSELENDPDIIKDIFMQ